MRTPTFRRGALALALSTLLAACGGSDDPAGTAAPDTGAGGGTSTSGSGTSTSGGTTTSGGGSTTTSGGTTTGGGSTSTGGGSTTTAGSLNDCIDPATATLPTGFSTRVVYDYQGVITGEQTVEAVINGAAAFEGQNATLTTATTTGTNQTQGVSVSTTTVNKVYQQAAGNGLVKTLGALIDATIGGVVVAGVSTPATTTSSKVVYDPAEENREFMLSLGQSVTKTTTVRTTTAGNTISTTGSTTHTYEARESITVPAGTYNTCRYRISSGSDVTTTWYIVGKGIMARSQATTSAGTQTIQLKSGTYNGAPL